MTISQLTSKYKGFLFIFIFPLKSFPNLVGHCIRSWIKV